MAFTTTRLSPKGGVINVFNADFAVGSGAPNHKDDVMLVQALMRIFYWELAGSVPAPPPGETKPIAVDGFAGPSTRKHIVKFQQDALSAKFNVAFDGRLDPFRQQGQLSTISKTEYALEELNRQCSALCRERGMNNFSNLPNREDVPATLRAALKTVKTIAAAYEKSFV